MKMKNVLSYAITIMLMAVVLLPREIQAQSVAINEANFPDPVFREYLLYYQNDGNGYLKESVKDKEELDLSYMDIKDLTGIEYFSGIDELDCSHCLLTKLDLSKNTRISDLWVNSNQLTSLNLAGTNVRRLWIQYNQLRGEAMDALINSMPTAGLGDGRIYVMGFYDDHEEGNLCTTAQYKALTQKGWTVYMDDHGDHIEYGEWTAQHGEPTAIDSISTEDAGDATVYDLQGRQLKGQPSKGISIIRQKSGEARKVIKLK